VLRDANTGRPAGTIEAKTAFEPIGSSAPLGLNCALEEFRESGPSPIWSCRSSVRRAPAAA